MNRWQVILYLLTHRRGSAAGTRVVAFEEPQASSPVLVGSVPGRVFVPLDFAAVFEAEDDLTLRILEEE